MTRSDSSERAWTAVFCGLLFLSFWFMVDALGTFPGLNGDEVYNVVSWDRWWSHNVPMRNPSGRYPNYLLTLLAVGSRHLFGPTVFAARLPIVTVAVAAIVCGALVLRRYRCDLSTALAWSAVLASHGVIIGYARFGWDSSTLFAAIPLVWLPLWAFAAERDSRLRWSVVSAGAFVMVLAHPLYVMAWWSLVVAALVVRRSSTRRLRWGAAVATAIALVASAIIASRFQHGSLGSFEAVWAFVRSLAEVVSGIRIYQYIVGTEWSWWFVLQGTVVGVVGVLALVAGYRHDRRGMLFWGLAGGLQVLFLFVTQPMAPIMLGYARYAFCCVPTFCLAIAWALTRPGCRSWGRGVLAAYVAIMLLSFQQSYFREGFATENAGAHPAFWCGSDRLDPEPKQKLANWLRQHADANTFILVSDFWCEKPLEYLLSREIGRYRTDKGGLTVTDAQWRAATWIVADLASKTRYRRLEALRGHLQRIGLSTDLRVVMSRRGLPGAWIMYPSRDAHLYGDGRLEQ